MIGIKGALARATPERYGLFACLHKILLRLRSRPATARWSGGREDNSMSMVLLADRPKEIMTVLYSRPSRALRRCKLKDMTDVVDQTPTTMYYSYYVVSTV